MKKPITPNSYIRSVLRRYVWLRSRERAAQLKRDENRCQVCGRKQSRAKGREVSVECHHVRGVDWTGLIKLIKERLLGGELVTLCVDCHKAEHKQQTK